MSNDSDPRCFRVYSSREASHLSGLTPYRLGQWARRGYIPSGVEGGRRVFSYRDIAEAMAVRKLLEAEFNAPKIRRAIDYLRDEFGDWPLQDAPLSRSDKGQWLVLKDGPLWDAASKVAGTGVMEEAVGRLLDVGEYLSKGGWAYVELGDLEHISVDPECMSGVPTIRGTRIEAMFVGKEARSKQGLRILEGYRLTPQQIDDAARWRDKALSYEKAA